MKTKEFTINQVSAISFGSGIRHNIGERLIGQSISRVLIITDEILRKMGLIEDIVKSIESVGIGVCVFDGAMPENPAIVVEKCAEYAKTEKVDAFVGVGGGSVLDLAKASRILMSNPSPIQLYFDMKRIRIPSKLPLILIPTTSGTSSEVSHGAMVYDEVSNKKYGFSGQDIAATCSYIDPELCEGMPQKITAATGIDCLCHATEALTSGINENPLSDILAGEAITLMGKYLLKAVNNGMDKEAREKMALACIWSGLAFDNAYPHLAHAMGHTIGAMYHVPHGEACGAVLPSIIAWSSLYKPEKVRMIGKSIDVEIYDNETAAEIGEKVGRAIRSLYLGSGCRPINELINEEDIDKIAAETMNDAGCFCVPYPVTTRVVKEIIHKEFSLQISHKLT